MRYDSFSILTSGRAVRELSLSMEILIVTDLSSLTALFSSLLRNSSEQETNRAKTAVSSVMVFFIFISRFL